MIDLSNPSHIVPVVPKVLGHRNDFGNEFTEVAGVGVDVRLFRIEPGHERSPTGIADRILRVAMLKPHTASRQSVDVGGFDERMPVASQVAIHVVRHDK